MFKRGTKDKGKDKGRSPLVIRPSYLKYRVVNGSDAVFYESQFVRVSEVIQTAAIYSDG